ncbi:MAG TPA: decarboxylating NADP(+)-dependent phosphogluconate dehydrogenase [Thermoanaerobaculia bacterium]|nr:decarboxylating NADP(+)-dependent phosphogluconate dehydrogenase [Thermoanaerobaculia bacterium]
MSANPPLAKFGMIGLGVMGENLALNVADHGFPVSVWNMEGEWVDRFINKHSSGRQLTGTKTFADFTKSLERPRKIMMLIKAGNPVDLTIDAIKPFLQEGDILIDGGNSWFKDTQEREARCKKDGLNFFGCGVSGGEEGARNGPSMMPGGHREAYESVRPIFEAIAAKTDSGACVAYCGPDGAGHFVKMVHNGIEYGDMQLIAEAYDLLRNVLGLDDSQLADVFSKWNEGPLESFLIEITSKIFRVKDPETGKPLVNLVMDKAGQKGTGKWTAQVALDLAVAIPTIASAIDARVMSSLKDERVKASQKLKGPGTKPPKDELTRLIQDVHDALYASKICAYAQGMSLIHAGSNEFKWNINLREMARIWKGGCIIRARFLDSIMRAYEKNADLPNLMLDDEFAGSIEKSQQGWRRALNLAQSVGVPAPAMSASLAYYDSYRTANLPQNLTQAQRDFFGSHTYERIDKPQQGFIHTDWVSLLK